MSLTLVLRRRLAAGDLLHHSRLTSLGSFAVAAALFKRTRHPALAVLFGHPALAWAAVAGAS